MMRELGVVMLFVLLALVATVILFPLVFVVLLGGLVLILGLKVCGRFKRGN